MKQGFWLALLFVVAIPLLGALGTFPQPVVVIYPLTVNAGTDPESGSNIAILYSTKLTQEGGIEVKPYTPGTDRAQYLAAAQAEGADYYVSGFITPLGAAQVSILTQLVSTSSGTVVYSATTLATTYADASSEADTLHEAILAHARRGLARLDAPPPTESPTPIGNGGIDVGKVLGRHSRPTPKPSALPSLSPPSLTSGAVATPPSAPPSSAALALSPPAASAHAALVFNVAGDADAAAANAALTALVRAFQRAGMSSGHLPAGASDGAHAAAICQANAGARALYAPTLTLARSTRGAVNSVQLDVTGYDCNGATTGSAHVVEPAGRHLDGALSAAASRVVETLLAGHK